MEELHDIEGLDYISHWPLAIGWWVVLMIALVSVIGIAFYIRRRITFKRSWRGDALMQLSMLEKNLSEKRVIDVAVALSDYLRRIAVRRYSREECAGLAGSAWLQWLVKHDPKHYDWENKGCPLIEAPYGLPPNITLTTAEIRDLIQATRRLVR